MSVSPTKLSISPEGESFSLPEVSDYAAEYERVRTLAEAARSNGQEIVVVMGVGFVGAVMAAIVADCEGPDGRPSKFVIGCQRPSTRSYWKIPLLNRGVSPVKAEDPQVDVLIGPLRARQEVADRDLQQPGTRSRRLRGSSMSSVIS